MRKIVIILFLCLAMFVTACANGIVVNTEEVNEEPTTITINLEKMPDDQVAETSTLQENVHTPDISFKQDIDLYRNILDLYEQVLSEQQSQTEQSIEESAEWSSLVYAILHPQGVLHPLSGIGFAFQDLNSDGTDELLLGWSQTEDWSLDEGYVFAIYTIANGTISLAIEGAERCRYVIGIDDYLYQNGSDSAWESNYTKYRFNSEHANYLEPIDEVFSYMNDKGNCSWKRVTNADDIGAIEYTGKHEGLEISEDEAWLIGEGWMNSGMKIEHRLMSEYSSLK